MRQGGRYVVDKPGGKPRRVEWTKTQDEAAAESKRRPAQAEPREEPVPAEPKSGSKST